MSENDNSKAAGDAVNVENIKPAEIIATEKSTENGVSSVAEENKNVQCLEKINQHEICSFPTTEKNGEQLSKVSTF